MLLGRKKLGCYTRYAGGSTAAAPAVAIATDVHYYTTAAITIFHRIGRRRTSFEENTLYNIFQLAIGLGLIISKSYILHFSQS